MLIRPYTESDWSQVWPIVREVAAARDTFTYDPDLTCTQARELWIEQPPALTVVAVDGDEVLGTAKMGANQAGPGSHVSTASFMVAPRARDAGVGTALCRHAVDWARTQGYAAMQFNAVVDTNTAAVRLYRREGFTIIGTVPRAFAHPTLGRVGLHVMHREL